MTNVVIKISFNTKREGFMFEVRPEHEGVDVGDRATESLLEGAAALMSATGLSGWQIVENLESFVDEVRSKSTRDFRKWVHVVSQQ